MVSLAWRRRDGARVSVLDDDDRATILADDGELWLSAGGVEFTALFYAESELGQRVRGERPSILARHSDISAISVDDMIRRQSTNQLYRVRDLVRDGVQGFTHLMLEEAS